MRHDRIHRIIEILYASLYGEKCRYSSGAGNEETRIKTALLLKVEYSMAIVRKLEVHHGEIWAKKISEQPGREE
jgi:hypothetical protein